MIDNLAKLLLTIKNMFHTLIIILICTVLIWYIQYHWKRRKLYQMAAQRKGPFPLPFIGSALYFLGSTNDILNNIIHLSQNFESPVPVWLGQKLFFGIYTAKDMETIMNNPNALGKDELYKFSEILVHTGLFSAPVPKWKKHRKIIAPTFNQKILDEFVEIFAEQSDILVEKLKIKAGNGIFDVADYVSRCTLDIICETAMGVTVNAQTTESDYVNWSNKAMEVIFTRMFGIIYHSDWVFNRTSMAKEFYKIIKKMHNFTGTVVTEKRKAYQKKMQENKELAEATFEEDIPKKRNTFLQQLIELSENGANFTDEELREEVDTFMIAGSDTTASMNSFTFMMLGMFPDVQEKVYEEVMNVVAPNKSVECKDLGKLKYLERVIKETMRIFPVGPVIVRAITEDIKLETCTIPAGSSVVIVIFALHRDPNVWLEPLKFDPDRFLPEEVAKRHPYSWLPFSGGPRNCIGMKYGMMAMKTLIATVIRKYRFSADYKRIEDIKLKLDLMLKPVDGYRISVELRE